MEAVLKIKILFANFGIDGLCTTGFEILTAFLSCVEVTECKNIQHSNLGEKRNTVSLNANKD